MQLKGAGVLQIEPSDHCNLQCKMCAPHRDNWSQVHGVPKGHLSVPLWDKILAGFVEEQISFDHIIFQWLGDPLLHPNLDLLISKTAKLMYEQVGYLRVDTNAILLDPQRARNLVEAACGNTPPLLMVFSIDAATPEVYLHTKGRDMLRVVRKNIRYLLQLRKKKAASCNLNVQLQFVVQPENAHETEMFLQYWKDLLECYGGAFWHDEISS